MLMLGFDRKVFWFASRASGLVLWLVLAASVLWGFAVSSRLIRRKGLPAWMLGLHRHLGTLSLVFMVAHLGALWADSYVSFGPKELFVPMASRWRPGAVTWGIVAFYLLVVVQLTSWAMRRLPRRLWHAAHLLSLPLLVTGTAHGILAGADWSNRIVQWVLLLVSVTVVWLASFRLLTPAKDPATADRLAAVRAAAARATSPSAPVGADPVPSAGGPVPPAPVHRPGSPWAPPDPEMDRPLTLA